MRLAHPLAGMESLIHDLTQQCKEARLRGTVPTSNHLEQPALGGRFIIPI